MIDKALLRENLAETALKIKRKDPKFPVEKLIEYDEKLRSLQTKVEALRKTKNDLAQQAKGGVTAENREQSIAVGLHLKTEEAALATAQELLDQLYLSCPNIPFDDVPVGDKDENVVVREFGKKPEFSFPIKNHLELGQQNGWFNFEAAAKMACAGFVFYNGASAKVMHALSRLMLKNNSRAGYEVMIPPSVVNAESLVVASNFPKFKEEVFSIVNDGLYLIPTSEVSLANLYRDEIIPSEKLPIRMTSWTSCFRREAGNYGKMERGLIRVHQFEKVELFTLCEPENSAAELDKMIACAESILQKLGLHYRVSLLAGQDCSFPSAKTYDIEVWLPGQNRYYEVSSASNCTDFQSRRGKIRYRSSQGEKTQLVHTLNASSLAFSRLMVALMETYQQVDGTIELPQVLKDEMF